MSRALEAAARVLSEADGPLHYKEIAKRALEKRYWKTDGKTPAATVNAQLSTEIKKHGEKSPFRHVGRGMFGLAEVAIPEPQTQTAAPPTSANTVSFTDAAEQVLERFGAGHPMHYRDIASKALQLGLIATTGRTPEATLYSSIVQENQRRTHRAEQPRFHMHGKGMMGLTRWLPTGIPSQIEQHNRTIRQKLHEELRAKSPGDFEDLIGRLLAKLGFDEVAVTGRSGDGGIDVRGTLVVGDAARTRMAVQAKRWKHNVQAPIVQQVRGSLGAHEQGLIITTSDFSAGARQEAERNDAVPVGLMKGDQLVSLLVEFGIGVRKTHYHLLELGESTPEEEQE